VPTAITGQMWHGDELDSMLMDAAQALDLARAPEKLDGCTVLLIALRLPHDPEDDLQWGPEQLVQSRLADDGYAESFGMLHD